MAGKVRGELDRSAAHAILLDVFHGFADSPDDGGATITRFLEAWYADTLFTSMYAFAEKWVHYE